MEFLLHDLGYLSACKSPPFFVGRCTNIKYRCVFILILYQRWFSQSSDKRVGFIFLYTFNFHSCWKIRHMPSFKSWLQMQVTGSSIEPLHISSQSFQIAKETLIVAAREEFRILSKLSGIARGVGGDGWKRETLGSNSKFSTQLALQTCKHWKVYALIIF